MNCEPGDLAILINAHREAESCIGKIYKLTGRCSCAAPHWLYEGKPEGGRIGFRTWRWDCLPDEWLRPIRDNPGQDETLTWAPVPSQKVTA